MTTKKGAKKKSTSFKKNEITQMEQENISPEESNLIEDSFNLIKNLNVQVSNVESAKKKLESDVSKLSDKLNKHEEKTHHNKLLVALKEEIVKDFAPLLNKLDFKGLKVDVSKEITNLLDVELNKLRAEFETSSSKVKKDFSKMLSDLELRVVDSLRENTKLKKELKDFDGKEVITLISNLEKKFETTIKSFKVKSQTLDQKDIDEINKLKKDLTKQSLEFKKSLKEFDKIKKLANERISDEEINFTSYESKLKALEKEFSSIKSLLERFENDLYSDSSLVKVKVLEDKLFDFEKILMEFRNYTETQIKGFTVQLEGISNIEESFNESFRRDEEFKKLLNEDFLELKKEVETLNSKKDSMLSKEYLKVEESLSKTSQVLIEFEKLKDVYNEIISEKFNSIISDVESFENRIENLEKVRENTLRKEFSSILKSESKTFSESLTDEIRAEMFRVKDEIEHKSESFLNQSEDFKKDLLKFKDESQSLFKKYLEELTQELDLIKNSKTQSDEKNLIQIKEIESRFDQVKEAQKGVENFIHLKYNDLVKAFESLALDSEKQLSSLKTDLTFENKNILDSLSNKIKEDFSKEVLKLNEVITNNNTLVKESQRDLAENIELKFLSVKDQFSKEFKDKISNFEGELIKKESEFVNKLIVIEDEKNQMIQELSEFKVEVSNLTKNYSQSLDLELAKLQEKEDGFESKKKDFLTQIDDVIHVRRVQIEEDYEHLKKKLENFVEDSRSYFLEQDNNFRTTFGEKVKNLQDHFDSNFNRIEKKFIEKNVLKIKDGLKEDFEKLRLFEETLTSRVEEIKKREELFEQKELDFFESLHSEQDVLKEKNEERLMVLEKQFNKRFLDFDSKFSDFKSIVVDEVEDLMKEVNTLVKSKFDKLDSYETKLKVLISESERRVHQFSDIQGIVEREVKDVRDEVNDLRVKVDLQDPDVQIGNLSSLVSSMADYENHLIGLVDSLRNRGVNENQILDILISKGHPRVYASMILKSDISNKN